MKLSFKNTVLISIFIVFQAEAKSPDCSSPNNWAASMAFVHLKNAGIFTNDQVDFTKTTVKLLASQRIKNNLYKQVHQVIFTEKSGKTIEAVTSNDASNEECSISDVDVYLISKHLGNS